MEIWPNFFIVGAPRSGTTSMYEYLKDTTGIFMSPVKEPNFFSRSVNPDVLLSRPIRNEKKYLQLFKEVKEEKAIGEASPTYLWDPIAPGLIHETIPESKIIMILRNPIKRSFSHYLLLVGLGTEKSTFSNATDNALNSKPDYSGRILEASKYYEQVKRYMSIFEKDKIKIIIFEEFVKETHKKMKEVLDFLGVNSEPPSSIKEAHNAFTLPRGIMGRFIVQNKFLRKAGKNLLPRSAGKPLRKIFTENTPPPEILPKEKEFLTDYFSDDVKKLEELLNRKLPWGFN